MGFLGLLGLIFSELTEADRFSVLNKFWLERGVLEHLSSIRGFYDGFLQPLSKWPRFPEWVREGGESSPILLKEVPKESPKP